MIGTLERHELTLTPRDAARAATQIARGTYDPKKTWDEQPANAQPGRAVKLLDDDTVVMSCRPTIRGSYRAPRSAKRTMAACDIAPSFKKQLRKRRRAKR